MPKYRCLNCGHIYDEKKEAGAFTELGEEWKCPTCFSEKSDFIESDDLPEGNAAERKTDELEPLMEYIYGIARTGETVIEPMRTRKTVIGWDDILI